MRGLAVIARDVIVVLAPIHFLLWCLAVQGHIAAKSSEDNMRAQFQAKTWLGKQTSRNRRLLVEENSSSKLPVEGGVQMPFDAGIPSAGGQIFTKDEDEEADDEVAGWEFLRTTHGNASGSVAAGNGASSFGRHMSFRSSMRSFHIYRQWVSAYGLADQMRGRSPRLEVHSATFVPASHLQDCPWITDRRKKWDRRKNDGSLPKWFSFPGINVEKLELAGLAYSTKNSPSPPWVKGGDDENIPLTRIAQALIWAHQHPRDCSDPSVKFAVGHWAKGRSHGIGSQLHILTTQLQLALEAGRVFVLAPDWPRALHPGCSGYAQGRLDCYFFPVTSRQCEERALSLWDKIQNTRGRNYRPKDADVVWGVTPWRRRNSTCPPGWPCTKWSQIDDGKEVIGRFQSMSVDWWRAQAIRYILRFPSEYLCHQANIARHESYGRFVAREVARSQLMQRYIAKHGGIGTIEEGHLEESLWAEEEPFVPRPILSMHVRQGGKAKEMTIHPFPAFVEQAERIRRRNPSLKHIWLMTMLQSIVDTAELYSNWKILYTQQSRLQGKEEQAWHDDITTNEDKEPGLSLKRSVDKSFCNLLIASSADFFVGTLGSNWDRLLDELRKTGGKMKRGYVSLNYGQWR